MLPCPNELPLLDQEYLKENFHDVGFSYLIPDILKLFQDQTAVYLDKLDQLFQRHDLQGLAAEAHTLRGTAGSVGAAAIAEIAQQIENSAPACDSATLAALVEQLHRVATLTDAAITAELARPAKNSPKEPDFFA